MATRTRLGLGAGALAAALLVGACSGQDDDDSGGSFDFGGARGNNTGSGGATSTGTGTGTGTDPGSGGRPPEVENETRYLAPVATGRYLWTANPLSGKVAVIDAITLGVRLDTAGNGPTEVAGLPEVNGQYGALVLNVRSDDATLFRLSEAGALSKLPPFRVHAYANAWTVSPSGRWAIAWTDVRKVGAADPLETFQDVTLFSLEPGAESATPLSVAPRPSAFAFDEAETHLYAVTQEGLSVIELGDEPEVSKVIGLSDDPFADARARDVSFAKDGSYAVIRSEGDSAVNIVSLPEGAREELDFGSTVTDLDLSPDGSRAFVVLGLQPALVVVPLPVPATAPSDFDRVELTGERVGAIALNADASAGLVYSTVLGSTRVVLVDTDPSSASYLRYRARDVISPLTAVFASPDPRFAVGFQAPATGSKKAGAFSLLSLEAERAPKIVATDAAPAQLAFAPDGLTALVSVRSDTLGAFGAYLVALQNQQVDFVALESPPVAAGLVPAAGRAYIAQSHPEGRITFLSLTDGAAQTITGFELIARIRQ
jgi:hypothetical protein